ncbi:hypothetical protein G9H64_01760 [Aquirufa nivalisilvae]|uniref:hypothetical protein n=1 Tax=Aquirufa nivalisilvae TaxID=2516557 RepID=UPI0022A8F140|nr:hypothetical protein [Aquirufa nivalisilvae]MCZ2479673.1 hypothetical protein [Aquirufa nivalisilvae]MCZ2481668.1 hypothetical protein [Aquirufa nivalisilvae]
MKKWISFKLSVQIFLGFIFLAILFHLLVMAGVVPPDIVWGGRLQSQDELIKMESISLIILVFMALIIAIKARWIFFKIAKVADYVVWLIPLLFFLNTWGNLQALNAMERFIFTPITLVLTLISLRIALEKIPH